MPKSESQLLICRESFVGSFSDYETFVGVRGKTVIDPATDEGKRVLKNWSKFFGPVLSREEENANVPLQVAL
jgi:hypothetical protein